MLEAFTPPMQIVGMAAKGEEEREERMWPSPQGFRVVFVSVLLRGLVDC